jgi:hypothetical protein
MSSDFAALISEAMDREGANIVLDGCLLPNVAEQGTQETKFGPSADLEGRTAVPSTGHAGETLKRGAASTLKAGFE